MGGIELDVQRCASGELIVFHDEELTRTTNGAGLVKDCTLEELRRLSAGAWFDNSFADERIPALREVLDLVAGRVILNIELKNSPVEYPCIEDDLLDAIRDYPHESLIISSFDQKLMQTLHARAPHLQIALLAGALFVDLRQSAAAIGATYFHPAYDCFRPDIAQEAKAAGLRVNVWTCNSPAEWRECIKMRVDGIVTDDPEGLKFYLAQVEGMVRKAT